MSDFARLRLNRAREATAAAVAAGDYVTAHALLEAALRDEELDDADRVTGLASLASLLRLQNRWREAEATAQEAVELAAASGDERALARACLEQGTLLLLAFEREEALSEPEPWAVAMSSLETAADIYESLGSVDFYVCLLTIARALALADESPDAIYGRIAQELDEERWRNTAGESPDMAEQIRYLRGRALFELGTAEDAEPSTARAQLQAARELFRVSRAPDARSIIERIDELLA